MSAYRKRCIWIWFGAVCSVRMATYRTKHVWLCVSLVVVRCVACELWLCAAGLPQGVAELGLVRAAFSNL